MTPWEGGPAPAASLPDLWKEAYARLYRQGRADFPPACLHYVETVVRQAALSPFTIPPHERDDDDAPPDDSGERPGEVVEKPAGRARSLPPAAVITAFRNAARHDFGPLRDEVLREWGLLTPFDLGRAIGLLGHIDRLTLEDGDAPAFYANDPRPLAEDAPADDPAEGVPS